MKTETVTLSQIKINIANPLKVMDERLEKPVISILIIGGISARLTANGNE
ncbi:MAG: hypothetical protein LBJ01_03785 [Tannerella sp.]|jgi:hypothetical protein|nr:hypothetical protein [Tannerella sp.]